MPGEKRPPLKVFLCHAKADKQRTRELYVALRKRQIRPWFDEEDLVGGQDWQTEIPKAVATSDAVIICLTKNVVNKEGYVQKEIKFALDKALEMPDGRIFLIPVRFEECEVPPALSRYQWVNLFEHDGLSRLIRALRRRAEQLEQTREPPESATRRPERSTLSEQKPLKTTQQFPKPKLKISRDLKAKSLPTLSDPFADRIDELRDLKADDIPFYLLNAPAGYGKTLSGGRFSPGMSSPTQIDVINYTTKMDRLILACLL